MTEEEKIICKQFLNDADKTHSCNEYKLLMALLEQEPFINKSCVSSGVCEHDKNKVLDKITEIIEPLRHLSIDEMSDIEWQILQIIDKYKGESENV